MPQLLIAVILLIGMVLFVRWLLRASPATLAAGVRRAGWIGGGLGAIGLVGLIATRNPGFLLGLLFFLAPLLLQLVRQWQLGRGLGGGWRTASTKDERSEARAEYLVMTLDHASGDMQGRVLKGRFAGRELSDLDDAALLDLLAECAGDADSSRLLEAYLDRRLGSGWRRQDNAGATGANGAKRTRDTDMTVEDAWQVLGLAPGASEEEIRAAHRRLMQTVHPDRGGSSYLAARVNRAKDLLLQMKQDR